MLPWTQNCLYRSGLLSFKSEDGRSHRFKILSPVEKAVPLVVYLPAPCESRQFNTSRHFSLLTFELEDAPMDTELPLPKWIVELLLFLRGCTPWNHVAWYIFARSRGAAWALEVANSFGLQFTKVMLVSSLSQLLT